MSKIPKTHATPVLGDDVKIELKVSGNTTRVLNTIKDGLTKPKTFVDKFLTAIAGSKKPVDGTSTLTSMSKLVHGPKWVGYGANVTAAKADLAEKVLPTVEKLIAAYATKELPAEAYRELEVAEPALRLFISILSDDRFADIKKGAGTDLKLKLGFAKALIGKLEEHRHKINVWLGVRDGVALQQSQTASLDFVERDPALLQVSNVVARLTLGQRCVINLGGEYVVGSYIGKSTTGELMIETPGVGEGVILNHATEAQFKAWNAFLMGEKFELNGTRYFIRGRDKTMGLAGAAHHIASGTVKTLTRLELDALREQIEGAPGEVADAGATMAIGDILKLEIGPKVLPEAVKIGGDKLNSGMATKMYRIEGIETTQGKAAIWTNSGKEEINQNATLAGFLEKTDDHPAAQYVAVLHESSKGPWSVKEKGSISHDCGLAFERAMPSIVASDDKLATIQEVLRQFHAELGKFHAEHDKLDRPSTDFAGAVIVGSTAYVVENGRSKMGILRNGETIPIKFPNHRDPDLRTLIEKEQYVTAAIGGKDAPIFRAVAIEGMQPGDRIIAMSPGVHQSYHSALSADNDAQLPITDRADHMTLRTFGALSREAPDLLSFMQQARLFVSDQCAASLGSTRHKSIAVCELAALAA